MLEVAQRDTIIVGVIGNLEPDKPEFKEYFDRYRKHPLFRGIRYGNLWGRDIAKQAENPAFIDGLKLLADADLVLDTANPRMALLEAMLRISDKVPNLRIVLDHLPNFEPTRRRAAGLRRRAQGIRQAAADLREAVRDPPPRRRSGVDRRSTAIASKLDLLVGDVRRGSHPVRQRLAQQRRRGAGRSGLRVAKEYFATKPRAVAEKYFWKNSVAAYKWVKREPAQPSL